MKHYLVGGAVRDRLLGLPVVDRDWVVVGGSPEEMLAAGYRSVGKDFPVFLHPQTHEQYALARLERKSGPGYHGFEFSTDAKVTLEEDLSRRDLTINAIAERANGELVDPFNGCADIASRTLRHVSEAFIEDPVRILRVARFMARFSYLGFSVADETLQLMRHMVDQGEATHLVPERVWQETSSALQAHSPQAFIETLRACDALAVVLPEVDALFGVPQPVQWHPEVDCGRHTLLVLEQAALISPSLEVRFAALCHDLGKATTPQEVLPSHPGHEKRGASIAESLSRRLHVPRHTEHMAALCARWHTHTHRSRELRTGTLHDFLQALDVIRKPERFEHFLDVCTADARGREGHADTSYPQAEFLRQAAVILRQVDGASIARQCTDRSQIAERIREARIQALRDWRAQARTGQ